MGVCNANENRDFDWHRLKIFSFEKLNLDSILHFSIVS